MKKRIGIFGTERSESLVD